MLKKVLIIMIILFCLSFNTKLIKSDNFNYNEQLILEGSVKNWELECKKLNCEIIFSLGSNDKKMFSKKIVLKNIKENRKIQKKIYNGMKEKNKVVKDYYSYNILKINNKQIYSTKVENTKFYKLLNELLGENYINIEKRICENIKLNNEKNFKENIKQALNKLENKNYEIFNFRAKPIYSQKHYNDNSESYWILNCNKENCKIEYEIFNEIKFLKKIKINEYEKKEIIKKILENFYNIKKEKYFLSYGILNLNNELDVEEVISNIDFYNILNELLGENYEEIERRIFKEEINKDLKNIKEIKNFYYEESEIILENKKIWELKCKELECEIKYTLEKEYSEDIIKNFTKKIKLENEKQKEKILIDLINGLNDTAIEGIFEFSAHFEYEKNKKEIIFLNQKNINFYKILSELLGENFYDVEKYK